MATGSEKKRLVSSAERETPKRLAGLSLNFTRVSTEKLAAIRNNFLEHQNYPRGEFMDYYKPDVAQVLFDSAWQEAEAMLAVFISQRFPANVKLRIIPEKDRDPNFPKKFGLSIAK
jgi:hypothetical protein